MKYCKLVGVFSIGHAGRDCMLDPANWKEFWSHEKDDTKVPSKSTTIKKWVSVA